MYGAVAYGYSTELDVPYGPDPLQRLDLYLPAHTAHAPLVLFVHGGGWSVGDKSQYASVGERLAGAGLVAAMANYRLSPAVQHPAHAEDVARAVAWCYRHAPAYGADPQRFCLMGHSSGAHLASLVALDPIYLAAHSLVPGLIGRVLGVSGVGYDLNEDYAATSVGPFFVDVFGADATRWAQAAPLQYVLPSAPPFLLIHGLGDTEAPPASTEVFAAALQRAGVPVELDLIPGENHVTVMFAVVSQVLAFLHAPWPALTAVPAAPATNGLTTNNVWAIQRANGVRE